MEFDGEFRAQSYERARWQRLHHRTPAQVTGHSDCSHPLIRTRTCRLVSHIGHRVCFFDFSLTVYQMADPSEQVCTQATRHPISIQTNVSLQCNHDYLLSRNAYLISANPQERDHIVEIQFQCLPIFSCTPFTRMPFVLVSCTRTLTPILAESF